MSKAKLRKRTDRLDSAREETPVASSAWPLRVATAALYASLLLLYAPSLTFAPITLDDASLLEQFAERSPSSLWTYDHFSHLRPLKNLFFYLLARAPDATPVFRGVVLLCFLGSVGLVQRLASKRLDSPGWGLAAAGVWAFNPTLTSVLVWLAASNLAFCLLGVLTFATFAGRVLDGRGASGDLGRSTLIALLGLLWAVLSHELALLAPLLLALNFRELRTPRARPLVIGSLACVALLLVLRAAGTPAATGYRFDAHPAWLLVLSSARYLLDNLRLWLWAPGRFGVLFVEQPSEHLVASVLCWVVVLVLAVAVFRIARRDRAIAFGTAWVAIFLLPVTNLVPLGNTPVALHYLYLPSVGLAVLAARGCQRVAGWISRRGQARRAWLPALGLGMVIVAWLPEHRRELRAWGDEALLYGETVRNQPSNVEARVNLVSTWIGRGRYDEADELVRDTLPLAPNDPVLIRNAFEVMIARRSPADALAFADAHAAQLDLPVHDFQRGELLERLERHPEARDAFRRALDRAPNAQTRVAAGYRLAIALLRTQQSVQASRLIDRLLTEFPDHRELRTARELLAAPGAR